MHPAEIRKKRDKTPDEALAALMRLCARAEKSEGDARRLMRGWGVAEKDAEQVLGRLVRDRFIDDSRYAEAFVREKLRLSGWGEYKIRTALQRKGVSKERIDAALSQADRPAMGERLAQAQNAVIPGFYGALPDGSVKTFSRGGSDVTGAIVARAVMADLYENWTDVSGFLMADPRIVREPQPIKLITYRELRELSYMGATVLHEDSIFPVKLAGIPINIRNTNRPSDPGTMIVPSADSYGESVVTGIAGKKGFAVVHIEKDMMNQELGFGMRVLQVLNDMGLCFEHLPSGIDTMGVVLDEKAISGKERDILAAIAEATEPDHIEIEKGLSLIAVVGRGMIKTPGTASRVFTAVARAGINIRMIDQGSSELNIILAVDERDFERAIDTIYREFVHA